MEVKEEEYWTNRYINNTTGWDIGNPSTPLKEYIDQLTDKSIKILIPGAGNAYEAEYLIQKGFENIYVLDISNLPLAEFAKRNPTFNQSHLIKEDFFLHEGNYDLIFEQTFFCSFPPLRSRRIAYVEKMHSLLNTSGKLVGLWFDIPLTGDMEKRPFGGDKALYLEYFEKYFNIETFESCYNSIPPRSGNEFFGILSKKVIAEL